MDEERFEIEKSIYKNFDDMSENPGERKRFNYRLMG
jgi:hypothetical protein